MKNAVLAVFLTLTVIASPVLGTATATPGVNFSSETAPNPTAVEDELTIVTHNRGEMDPPLEYYNDSGEITSLPATVNQSQETPVGVRFDKIDADRYTLFLRADGEVENSATWTVASDWTTSSGASSLVSVTDADGVFCLDSIPAVRETLLTEVEAVDAWGVDRQGLPAPIGRTWHFQRNRRRHGRQHLPSSVAGQR